MSERVAMVPISFRHARVPPGETRILRADATRAGEIHVLRVATHVAPFFDVELRVFGRSFVRAPGDAFVGPVAYHMFRRAPRCALEKGDSVVVVAKNIGVEAQPFHATMVLVCPSITQARPRSPPRS